MFQSYFPQRRFNMNTWMPSAYYGMGGPSFMPPMLDIFDPLEELSREISRSLRWIETPTRDLRVPRVPRGARQLPICTTPTKMIQQQPSMVKTLSKKALASCKTMPQKYRIAIDCTGINRQEIRTNLVQNKGQCHLIVECGTQGKQRRGFKCGVKRSIGGNVGLNVFRRSFTLPRNVDCKKMVKYVTPNGQFVIEFPLLELPTCCKDATLVPRVVNCNGTKVVSLKVPIPEMVNPAKLQVAVKDRELILRFENRIEPDTVSRVYCYTKVTLPPHANLNAIKCRLGKKRLLTICAPVITGVQRAPTIAKYRCIAIERKLRHRISGKLPAIHAVQHKQIMGKPTPVTGRKQITAGKKQKQPTRGKLPIPQVSGKKQQLPAVSGGKKEVPSQKERPVTPTVVSQKKKTEQPTGRASPIKRESSQPKIKKQLSQPKIKKQSSEKKLFPQGGMGKEQQGVVFTTGAETKSSGSKSPRRVPGSEVLHQIFSSSSSQQQQQQGRKSPVTESSSGQQNISA